MLFPCTTYSIEIQRSLYLKLSKTPVENNNPINNIFCIPKSTYHPTNKKPHGVGLDRMEKYNVAIVGVTGNVGRELLGLLYERNFPVNEVFALASHRSKGKKVYFGKEMIDLNIP